jgi:hypothetical protein
VGNVRQLTNLEGELWGVGPVLRFDAPVTMTGLVATGIHTVIADNSQGLFDYPRTPGLGCAVRRNSEQAYTHNHVYHPPDHEVLAIMYSINQRNRASPKRVGGVHVRRRLRYDY